MSDVLSRICATKRTHIEACKERRPLLSVVHDAHAAPPVRGFADRLRQTAADIEFAVIAEIKRASPSKGRIREDFDPPALARAYAAGGAACLSVLTDQPYFEGEDGYLTAAREAVDLPALRKDFMLDPYQVVEARALGADCILLIMAALTDAEAAELATAASDFGMDVLAEVHNRAELDRALKLPISLIGINNRDLTTLKVDIATTEALAPLVPADRVVISESGLQTRADLVRMAEAGARGFLVGESLMREADVTQALRRLLLGTEDAAS
jgi:indole-3-glycerol phosphate synthase